MKKVIDVFEIVLGVAMLCLIAVSLGWILGEIVSWIVSLIAGVFR